MLKCDNTMMRNKHVMLSLVAVLFFCLTVPVLARNEVEASATLSDRSGQAGKEPALQQIIEDQQRRLDSQQTQLDSQNKRLQELGQQLQELAGDPAVSKIGSTDKVVVTQATSIFPRRIDLQTDRRDDAQRHDDWEGSFSVKDTDTRIKIGGFMALDVIHDTGAIKSKGQFIPGSIVTRNATKKDGSDGQTNFSVSPSRLYIETRTPVNQKRVKTLLSIDLFDDEFGVAAEPRVRQAYVELSDILFGGDLLIGQAWSTTTDLESTPDVLDFRGVDGLFGSLQPQLRWSKEVVNRVKLMLALETAGNHIIDGADSITRMPDGILAVTWDSETFKLMASLLAADLRASFNNGPVESTVGFGVGLSGKVKLPFAPYNDNFLFSITYGKGIGSHFNNAQADAFFDTSKSSLEALAVYAVTLGYEHSWNEAMKSTFTYCCIEIDNHEAQPSDSLKGTEYASGNLVWYTNAHWQLGIEGIWGKRDDKDDASASNFRTLFASRYSF